MRFLIFMVVLIAVCLAGWGFYRGWFSVSTNDADQHPSATFSVDKAKFREDEQKARDSVQAFGQAAKDKIGDRDGKAK